MDLSSTIEADSTQINADDLTGSPRTVTITGVSKGTAEQPVNFEVAEFPGRAYRPCKSMRRVLVLAWGADSSVYVGRRLTLFNDPSVKWGGQSVGGVRIKAMSHIQKRLTVALTESRGKRTPFVVEPLPDAPPATPDRLGIGALFDKAGIPKDRSDDRMIVTRKIIGRDVAAYADLSPADVDKLQVQLTTWDLEGVLVDKVADILDIAAIEDESADEAK